MDVGEEVPDGVLAEDASLEVLGQEAGFVVGEVLPPQAAAVVLVEGGNGLPDALILVECGFEALHGCRCGH